jgi:predicted acetyltransferase
VSRSCPTALTVRELMAVDPAASAALWTDLLSRDLVARVPRRGGPSMTRCSTSWPTPGGRGRSCGRAVGADHRRPRCADRTPVFRPVDVVIEVRDELLPANAGRWRLTTAGAPPDGGGLEASCVPASGAPDVVLDVRELGAAYLGGTTLGALATAGLVTEGRPGAVRQLSAALSWDPAPWCPVNF